jgi:hypothetical protein
MLNSSIIIEVKILLIDQILNHFVCGHAHTCMCMALKFIMMNHSFLTLKRGDQELVSHSADTDLI